MANQRDVLFYIPHTHWEGAVFKDRAEYLDVGLANILRALRLLKSEPTYRFVLDQSCYVQPFLERYPEEEPAFRRFIHEGRLQIAGGAHVMADVNMPSGEAFIRQIQHGRRYFREALGVEPTVSWQLDTFGHHAQMPQLLRLAGYESFWFFRGVPNWEVPGEFQWEGIDGTRIDAQWLMHGYAVGYGAPQTLPDFGEFWQGRHEVLKPHSRSATIVAPAGADVCEPEPHVPALVEQLNAQPDRPFQVRIATPEEYENALPADLQRPAVACELNPVFQGAYSSRIELKQQAREIERVLTNAEKLGALLSALGLEVDDAEILGAWEPTLFNHAHDLMAGVMTDHVYEDTIRGYDHSERVGNDVLSCRLRDYAERVNTQGEGIPILVLNSLGWTRDDVVTATVGFTEPGVMGLQVMGPDGERTPAQLVNAVRDVQGALVEARVAFIARAVPALGHVVYHVRALDETGEGTTEATPAHGSVLETDEYRLEFGVHSGAIESLLVKDGGWEALGGPANVIAREEDRGDLWEPYRSLDGGSRIAMTEEHHVPGPGEAVFTSEQDGEPACVTNGPVFAQHAVGRALPDQGAFATTVRVYHGLARIEIRTELVNNSEFVRYRALFPTSMASGPSVHEIPFGAIERPNAIEFPAQNWVDHSDGGRGLTLLNRGLPGNNVADGTMMLSLLRSTRIVAYGFGGGYEPGMSSDTGLQLGRTFVFDYALVPHRGDWREARAYREGFAFNSPLIAIPAASHPGALPDRWGLLEVSHPNVIVSALRVDTSGSTILRVYEASGEATPGVSVSLARGAAGAEEVDLIGKPTGRGVEVRDDALHFDLHGFEIKTFRIRMGRGRC